MDGFIDVATLLCLDSSGGVLSLPIHLIGEEWLPALGFGDKDNTPDS